VRSCADSTQNRLILVIDPLPCLVEDATGDRSMRRLACAAASLLAPSQNTGCPVADGYHGYR
jgi:hypothetical protein